MIFVNGMVCALAVSTMDFSSAKKRFFVPLVFIVSTHPFVMIAILTIIFAHHIYLMGVLFMAKGGYFVIAYPPDLQEKGLSIDDINASIERSGGAVLSILHDKDIKEDGSPKDAHYHILCMWDKQVMDWELFKNWMIEHCCSSPHSWHDLNGVKHSEKYHQGTAQVHDVEACVHYMLHGGD